MDNNDLNKNLHQDDQNYDQDQVDAYVMSQLKTSQTLLTISVIAGPVSLVVGGVLLSSIALVCGIVGYLKIKKVESLSESSKDIVGSLRRQSLICIVACSAALVINGLYLVQTMSMYMEYIVNGDVQGLMDAMYGVDGSSASQTATDSSANIDSGNASSTSSNNLSNNGSDSNNVSVWDK